MKIRYSTNWMGPVSIDWYKRRGLTRPAFMRFKDQDVETVEITEQYSAGRIDVRDGSEYGDEIHLPPMRNEDWHRFSEWLETVETDDVWTLDQLVELYERANPKITWSEK